MDVREKLVELLSRFYGCDPMYYGFNSQQRRLTMACKAKESE